MKRKDIIRELTIERDYCSEKYEWTDDERRKVAMAEAVAAYDHALELLQK